MAENTQIMLPINIDKPRYDQSTYWGRARHFISVTNPLNVLASDKELDQAAEVVKTYRKTGVLPKYYDEDRLWAAKSLYDSAFHPDTGEKVFFLGRMSFQVPANTIITGGMLVFYKTTRATVFWQWVNQSVNAFLNYSNRSGDRPMPMSKLLISYCAATGSALGTALYLNSLTKSMPPIWGRLVPFAAVCAANCINIPLMRSSELVDGIPVFTKDEKRVGESRRAGITAISLVVLSRIIIAAPGMTLTPYLTNLAVKKGVFEKRPKLYIPLQLGLLAVVLTFATPLGCAIFPQQYSIDVQDCEPHIQENVKKIAPETTKLYYNKGL